MRVEFAVMQGLVGGVVVLRPLVLAAGSGGRLQALKDARSSHARGRQSTRVETSVRGGQCPIERCASWRSGRGGENWVGLGRRAVVTGLELGPTIRKLAVPQLGLPSPLAAAQEVGHMMIRVVWARTDGQDREATVGPRALGRRRAHQQRRARHG